MARGRRLVGLLTLLALLAIVIGVSGFEVQLPRLGSSATESALMPGVRGVAASMLLHVGSGAPPGGELAFVAVEPSGNLLVSDSRRRTVMRFDPSGHLLSEWGPTLGDTTLDEPAGVAVWAGSIYVLDRGTPRLLRLDGNGRLLAALDLGSLGTYGLNGLAVDPAGNVYAADTGHNRILVFAPTGAFLRQIGRAGNDLGGFTQPMMLAFAADGSFFVADWENSRIERFDASATATDAWPIGFHPFGVAVDALGRVFVPDSEHRRIEVYTPRGVSLGEIGAGGSVAIGVAPRQVEMARGPAAQPSLYVLGSDGMVRVDLDNTPPPPQGASLDVDLFSLSVIAVLVGLVLVAVQSRRGRSQALASGSLGAALERPIGLHAKNGAERQHQQPRPDEHLLIAHQTKSKQEPAREHHESTHHGEANHPQDRSGYGRGR